MKNLRKMNSFYLFFLSIVFLYIILMLYERETKPNCITVCDVLQTVHLERNMGEHCECVE